VNNRLSRGDEDQRGIFVAKSQLVDFVACSRLTVFSDKFEELVMREEKDRLEESSILQYIKAATSSSDRGRIVMIVMVTASVLVFVGFWNNAPGGWLDNRIEVRRDALRFFTNPGQPAFEPANDASLKPEERERYKKAKQFIENSSLNINSSDDRAQLLGEVMELRKLRIEKIRMIQLPFFGAVFDMNDMGIFAGITFAIVLLWFRYSLAGELRNFTLAFEEAESDNEPGDKRKLKLCYDLLAMHQVLTVPPMVGEKRRTIWVVITKAFFFIPLLIELEQLRLNWVTRSLGNVLSAKLMLNLLATNGVSVLITAILTWQCVSLSLRIDKVWNDAARKLAA
jgi:hypothetical protein